MRSNRVARFVLLFLCCIPLQSIALESDSRQPIHIKSNAATYDENKGESVYIGNVRVTQGSMQLNADRLVILATKSGRRSVDKLVATGKPVRFKQKPSANKEEIRGKSLRAEYYTVQSKLILYDQAEVWQGQNKYASEKIEYDTKNSIVKAGEKGSDSKRVHVILYPKK